MKAATSFGKKYLLVLLSFLLPLLVQAAAFAALGITPFGGKSLLLGDANAYYINYIEHFTRVLKGEHSPWYSFSKGAGGNMSALFSFYCLRPDMLIYLAAGEQGASLAFSLSVMIMTALCGTTMYLLLRDMHGDGPESLLISCCYALMGFLAVNNYNVIFIPGPLMLPLVAMGLRRMRSGRGQLLYILSLAYTIATFYQMGFIVCTAALLLFAASLYMHSGDAGFKPKKYVCSFCASSLLAGMLAAFSWLPALLSMVGGRASQSSLSDFVFTADFPTLSLGARLFSGAGSTSQLIAGLPAVFVGILPLELSILFFMDRNTERKKKISAAAILLFYFLGFYLKTFNSILQGFTRANWFDYRYSFVFSFIMLLLAAEQLARIEEISLRDAVKAFIMLVIFGLLVFYGSYEFTDGRNMIIDLLLLAVMGVGFAFHKKAPERAPRMVLLLLMLVCTSLQLYLNYYFSIKPVLKSWGNDESDILADTERILPIVEALKDADGGFYRMENESPRSLAGNDPLFFEYNGLGHNSYERYFVTRGMGKLGVGWRGTSTNWYDPGVPAAMDAFLGLRYIISEDDLAEQKDYIELLKAPDTSVWRNPYALGIAIPAGEEIMDIALSDTSDIFDIQNRIWQALSGDTRPVFVKQEEYTISGHNVFEDMEFSAEEALALPDPTADEEEDKAAEKVRQEALKKAYSNYMEICFTAERSGPVYFYDSAAVDEESGSDEDVLQYVGTYEAGDEVSARIYPGETINAATIAATAKGLYIYYADMELLAEYSALVNSRDVSLVKENDRLLSGTITSTGNERLLFTIPYDKGWELNIDGVTAEIDETMELFMSAQLPAGEHEFVLRYHVPGLGTGVALSVAGAIGILLLIAVDYKRGRKDREPSPVLEADASNAAA